MTVTSEGTVSTLSESAEWVRPETPFQEVLMEQGSMDALPVTSMSQSETPFAPEYLVDGEVVNDAVPDFKQLLFDLYDSEFDQALHELAYEADAQAELFQGEAASAVSADSFLAEWVEPLAVQAEELLGAMAETLTQRDPLELSTPELDSLLNEFEPETAAFPQPAFENFLKKLWKKAKKVVKGAVAVAKKGIAAVGKLIPIGPLLNKLKRLIGPLLQKVLKFALGKLPPALRPIASRLAGKFLKEADTGTYSNAEQPAMADLSALQQELDGEVASLLFAATEEEQELILAEASQESGHHYDQATLDAARERFVAELAELGEGADPTELVEEFIPAILPALRLGITVIGRPRVVKFLAGYVGQLIRPYAGKQATPALSQAIVDAGLRLMTLEAAPPDERLAGAEVMAAVVEDTLVKLSEQDEEVLTDDRLLEAATIEAFRESAAANIPSELIIPELRETKTQSGTWVSMPRGQRKKRYRKYTRVFDVTLTPAVTRTLSTFGGRPLAAVLPPSLRGRTIRARLHLYQAIPGTTLDRIARRERAGGGAAPTVAVTRKDLHPLTPAAAAALLEEPGLGRSVPERFMADPDLVAVGQRFYLLEVPNAAMTATAGLPAGLGPTAAERSSGAEIVVNLPANELRIQIYLSETDAQEIAASLRKQGSVGAVLARTRRLYAPVIRRRLSGHQRSGIRIVHETLSPDEFLGPGLRRLHGRVRGQFTGKVLVWVDKAIADLFQTRSAEFIAAAEDPALGVSLAISLTNPPGLTTIRRLLSRESSPVGSDETFTGSMGAVKVQVAAGFRA
jgi:hypothetical protein